MCTVVPQNALESSKTRIISPASKSLLDLLTSNDLDENLNKVLVITLKEYKSVLQGCAGDIEYDIFPSTCLPTVAEYKVLRR